MQKKPDVQPEILSAQSNTPSILRKPGRSRKLNDGHTYIDEVEGVLGVYAQPRRFRLLARQRTHKTFDNH